MRLVRYDYPNVPSANDLDRFFGEFMGSFPRFAGLGAATRGQSCIAADLYEDDANVYARFELPGFRRDEISAELENAVLTVSAERKASGEGAQGVSLSRSVSLPDGLEADRVEAKHEDGVLTVTLPKTPARKPKAIEIR